MVIDKKSCYVSKSGLYVRVSFNILKKVIVVL